MNCGCEPLFSDKTGLLKNDHGVTVVELDALQNERRNPAKGRRTVAREPEIYS